MDTKLSLDYRNGYKAGYEDCSFNTMVKFVISIVMAFFAFLLLAKTSISLAGLILFTLLALLFTWGFVESCQEACQE